jgi:Xaa-Pro aminopeptidase
VGPNAAIIHYKPEASTCSELDADKIYLCDSGAQVKIIPILYCNNFLSQHIQNCHLILKHILEDLLTSFNMVCIQYLDGTTDITRTVHFGKPTEHEKSCYTAVSVSFS